MSTNKEELLQQLEELNQQLYKKDKIIHALKERVKQSIQKSGDAFAIFERNIVLQGLVEEQTKNLQESAYKAEAGSKAKSDFLAQMSHEIRTPLNIITGMCHLLLRTDLTEQQQDYINKVKNSSQALLRIINDVLDVSKIEAGKMTLENIEFSIKPIIENITNIFGIKSENKDVDVVFTIDPTIPETLVGDPLRLEQILSNLCSNALKFTEQGQINILIKVVGHTESVVTLQFFVRDSGIGIEKEQAERLFQPFNQADDYTTRKYGGTGLGLSICKNLVAMMKGKIWLESQLDEGSTFYFTIDFPLAMPTDKEVFSKSDEVQQVALDANFSILVVDDNPLNLEIISEMLTDFGLTVHQANSGKKAINILNNEDIDLVLMDIQMPEMDGLETTRKIREKEPFKQLPILAMTAHAMEQDKQKSLDAGMNEHLTKPIDPAVLAEVLTNFLVK